MNCHQLLGYPCRYMLEIDHIHMTVYAPVSLKNCDRLLSLLKATSYIPRLQYCLLHKDGIRFRTCHPDFRFTHSEMLPRNPSKLAAITLLFNIHLPLCMHVYMCVRACAGHHCGGKSTNQSELQLVLRLNSVSQSCTPSAFPWISSFFLFLYYLFICLFVYYRIYYETESHTQTGLQLAMQPSEDKLEL